MVPDPTRQSLHPRRHFRVERVRPTVPAISCPTRTPIRKTRVALDSSAHAHALPFDAPAPSSPKLYNHHPCIFPSSLPMPTPSRAAYDNYTTITSQPSEYYSSTDCLKYVDTKSKLCKMISVW